MDKIARLFSFKGRIKRLSYWIVQVTCIASIIAAWTVGDLLAALTRVGLSFGAWGLVFGLVIGLFVSLAASTRRLHDRDKSAWWLLLFVGIPWVGRVFAILLGQQPELRDAARGIALITVVPLSVWAFVELGVLRGTRGPNRYGEDPLETGAPDSAPVALVS